MNGRKPGTGSQNKTAIQQRLRYRKLGSAFVTLVLALLIRQQSKSSLRVPNIPEPHWACFVELAFGAQIEPVTVPLLA